MAKQFSCQSVYISAKLQMLPSLDRWAQSQMRSTTLVTENFVTRLQVGNATKFCSQFQTLNQLPPLPGGSEQKYQLPCFLTGQESIGPLSNHTSDFCVSPKSYPTAVLKTLYELPGVLYFSSKCQAVFSYSSSSCSFVS